MRAADKQLMCAVSGQRKVILESNACAQAFKKKEISFYNCDPSQGSPFSAARLPFEEVLFGLAQHCMMHYV